MVTINKGQNRSGRPEFHDQSASTPAGQARLLGQNSLLQQLAPSKERSSFLLKLQWLINKILSYFTVKHPNLVENRIIRLLQAEKGEGANLQFGEMASHFQKFLDSDKDVSPELKKALAIAEKEHEELMALKNLPEETRKEAVSSYQTKKGEELAKMKEGESRLFALQRSEDDILDSQLFAILTKTGNAFDIRLVGTGSVIATLEKELPLAGKEKVHREIAYKQVPKELALKKEWLETLYQPTAVAHGLLEARLQELHAHKTKIQGLEEITTKTDKTAKLFWNVVHAFPTHGEARKEQRIKLRSHIWNLFELFHNHRYDLSANSATHQHLRKLFTAVSAEILQAYEKKDLSVDDLSDLKRELEVIDQTLRKAEEATLQPLKSSVPNEKHLFFGVNAKDMNAHLPTFSDAGNEITTETVRDQAKSLPPLAPITLSQPVAITLHPYSKLKTKDEVLNCFRSLYSAGEKQEFLKFFHEIPMILFHKTRKQQEHHGVEKTSSFWWQFSLDEQKEVMEKITKFTDTLTSDPKIHTFDQMTLESLLKMSHLLGVWEREALGTEKDYGLSRILDLVSTVFAANWRGGGRTIYDLKGEDYARFPILYEPLDISQVRDLLSIEDSYSYYLSEDIATDYKKRKEHPYSEQQQLFFARLGKVEKKWNVDQFLTTYETMQRLLKPIQNPFLLALYRQMDIKIHWSTDISKMEKVEAKIGWMSPEAVQTDPEGLFTHFLEELEEANEWFAKQLQTEKTTIPSFPLTYSDENKRQLLQLLRSENPQVEALNTLLNFPHFLRDPETRNFLDAIFFHPRLKKTLEDSDKKIFLEDLPKKLEAEILRHEKKFAEIRATSPVDQIFLKGEFEALLYLAELHEKLYAFYHTSKDLSNVAFVNLESKLQEWLKLSQEVPTLKGTTGYIARILLREKLQEETIAPKELEETVNLYLVAFSSPTIPYLLDPHSEQFFKKGWEQIVKTVTLPTEKIQEVLNRLVAARELPQDSTTWSYSGQFIYTNGQYQVNLATLSLSSSTSGKEIQRLPTTIFQAPEFISQFTKLPEQPFNVTVTQEADSTIYAFKDLAGLSCRVEVKGSKWTLYKKSVGKEEMWLQCLPPSIMNGAKGDAFTKELATEGIGAKIGALFKFFRMLSLQLDFPLPTLFRKDFYIDPKDPLKGYRLDENGNITMRFFFIQGKDGIELDHVIDSREGEHSYQLNLDADFQNSGLEFLHGFETAENILLWSQKGKLQKVELPRYGLTFTLNSQNQLVAQNPEFKDYYVVANPRSADKKHLSCALVLAHPDPTKPKKLLVPSSDALNLRPHISKPTAKGLGHLFLFFSKVIEFVRMLFGHRVRPVTEMRLSVGNQERITYTSFDLRAYTEEICLPEYGKLDVKFSGILQLARHYIAENDFARAYELIKRLSFTHRMLDSKLVNALIDFVRHSPSEMPKTAGEAALKFKLLLELKQGLKKEKTKKSVIQILNKLLLEQGKTVVAAGRNLPRELQLTKNEVTELGKIAKASDPQFYEKQLKVYFAPQGQHYTLGAETELKDGLDEAIALWKKERAPRDLTGEIQKLEEELKPQEALPIEKLAYPFKKLPAGQEIYRLFTPGDVNFLFKHEKEPLPHLDLQPPARPLSSCEQAALRDLQKDVSSYKSLNEHQTIPLLSASKESLQLFVKSKIAPLREAQESQLEKLKREIDSLIYQAPEAVELLSIYSGKKAIASFDELRIAFGLNKLDLLQAQGRLPEGISLPLLKVKMLGYFEALVRKNALDTALTFADRLQVATDEQQKKELSEALYRVLTAKCSYDASADPRFLVFEAQQFITFKSLEAGLDQLQLLEKLITDPFSIVQAPTGAGKTAILAVMQSLLKPNGENLVVQKVLPPLYKQTFEQYRDVLGNLFGLSVYPLRFSLKMRLTKTEFVRETDDKGIVKEVAKPVSIFKVMYDELLTTIKTRGCVLTDYKSLPLLEEKFWRLSQEFVEMQAQGVPPAAVLLEHHHYLRKLLILLGNKSVENMDEFDGPNRPNQKIQLDLGVGAHQIAPFKRETTIELYDLLLQDPELGLRANLQQDISDEMRKRALERVAKEMAKKLDPSLQAELTDYFLGKNEVVLAKLGNRPPRFLDKVAFCQRQLSLFLPLTLCEKRGSRYDRSNDGTRTVPCQNGEKTEAKFGTAEEQLNYLIQDYYQGGITSVDLLSWLKELKQKSDNSTTQQQRDQLTGQLQAVLPEMTLDGLADLMSNDAAITKEVHSINQSVERIRPFLLLRLSELKTSGSVISMGPQDNVNMSAAVSGTSATVGAAAALHTQFRVDEAMNSKIRANMIFRLKKRAASPHTLFYDPAHPNTLLTAANRQMPISAVIDGAGAYTTQGAKATAEILKNENKTLKQVGYHAEEDKISFVGTPSGDLKETGFVFTQSHTRGTDIPLASDAAAVLTLAEKDGLREVFQKEGRLRKPTQKYLLGMSHFTQALKTIENEIVHAGLKDAVSDAKDIFKAEVQRLPAIIRKAAKRTLLAEETIEGFLARFKKLGYRELFISSPEPYFEKDGEYFKANCHLKRAELTPAQALADYKEQMRQKAHALGLVTAEAEIAAITYSEEQIKRMPEKVAPIRQVAEDELEMELEVEQEEEMEQEEQLEVSLEQETEKVKARELGYYPVRTRDEIPPHSVKEKIHQAYDPAILMADSFLPLSRAGTAALRKRAPFDEAMFRVGLLRIEGIEKNWIDWRNPDITFTNVVMTDFIADTEIINKYRYVHYDLRTNSIVDTAADRDLIDKVLKKPEFQRILAQVRFFDGQTSGYSEVELQHLGTWLRDNNASQMKDHFLNQILRYRYKDKQEFYGSQLEKLFIELQA